MCVMCYICDFFVSSAAKAPSSTKAPLLSQQLFPREAALAPSLLTYCMYTIPSILSGLNIYKQVWACVKFDWAQMAGNSSEMTAIQSKTTDGVSRAHEGDTAEQPADAPRTPRPASGLK